MVRTPRSVTGRFAGQAFVGSRVWSPAAASCAFRLLRIYAKTERENWTGDEKRRAQALTEGIKQTYRRH
jgi:hypothetical protein